jgi:hypothetical protein
LFRNKKIKNEDLKHLNLSRNVMISNKGLKFCKNLKTLNLHDNICITDEGLIYMENLNI